MITYYYDDYSVDHQPNNSIHIGKQIDGISYNSKFLTLTDDDPLEYLIERNTQGTVYHQIIESDDLSGNAYGYFLYKNHNLAYCFINGTTAELISYREMKWDNNSMISLDNGEINYFTGLQIDEYLYKNAFPGITLDNTVVLQNVKIINNIEFNYKLSSTDFNWNHDTSNNNYIWHKEDSSSGEFSFFDQEYSHFYNIQAASVTSGENITYFKFELSESNYTMKRYYVDYDNIIKVPPYKVNLNLLEIYNPLNQINFLENSNHWLRIGDTELQVKDIYNMVDIHDNCLEAKKYSGYYNDQISFFDTATVVSTTLINKVYYNDEGDLYSYKIEGYFTPEVTDTYYFETLSDDASHVYIDDTLVVDNGGQHAVVSEEGSISLTAGTRYRIRIFYGEAFYGSSMNFYWKGGNQNNYTSNLNKLFSHIVTDNNTLLYYCPSETQPNYNYRYDNFYETIRNK